MGERVGQIAKTPEVKQSNSNSRVRKTERLQSMDTPVDRILFLQRTAGNQAVSRLMRSGVLQAKLRIGQPGDKYEQEADRVADAVMRMPEPGVQRQVEPEEEEEETLQAKPLANQITPLVQVQRQEEPEEEDETLQAKPLAGQITPLVQRQVETEEEEKELQAKATSGRIPEVNSNLESEIQSLKGGGQPLSENDRTFFEPRFGYDFSQVRVHTDTQAAESARAVNARAFTVGHDVVFGQEKYNSETSGGKRLLSHELAHVVQQSKANGTLLIQRWEDELVNLGFNPENDLEVILGPPLEKQSLNPDPETWKELYLYMKRLRRALSRSDPYFEKDMKRLLDRYFPGSGDKVWEDSRRPLAGYVGTRKGARRRMEMGKKLGLEETGKRRWKKKFMGSDVVFISGHHYGEGDLGSLDISKIRFRASRVKLVMVSSCSVLAPSSLRIWMKRFPNAYIIGWRSGSPYHQSNMMAKFLSKLPDDFLMEERSDMEELLAKWRSFVENLKEEGVRLRSEEGDPRSPWGVGYVTPNGRVTYYTRIKGKWRWVNR